MQYSTGSLGGMGSTGREDVEGGAGSIGSMGSSDHAGGVDVTGSTGFVCGVGSVVSDSGAGSGVGSEEVQVV